MKVVDGQVEKRNVGVLAVVDDADADRTRLQLEGRKTDFRSFQVNFLFGNDSRLFVVHFGRLDQRSGVGRQPNRGLLLFEFEKF